MNNKYSIQTLFSTPVYVSKLEMDLKPYLDLSLKEEYITISDDISHRKDHSLKSKSSFVLKEEKYIHIKNEIIKHINTYTKDILKCRNSFRITTSWFTYTNPGDQSYFHRHRNSVFSGVVYLQCDKDSGNITFETFNDISCFKLNYEEQNILNSTAHFFTPENNVIIMFPSKTYHKIERNNSKLKRVSLAFNVIPVGTFGDEDSTMTIV